MRITTTTLVAATLLALSAQTALAHRNVIFSNRCAVEATVEIVYLDHDSRTKDGYYVLEPKSGDRVLLNRGQRIRTHARGLWFRAKAGKTTWSGDGRGGGYRYYEDGWFDIDVDLKCGGGYGDKDAPVPDLRSGGSGSGGGGAPQWKILQADLGTMLENLGNTSTALVCGHSPDRDIGKAAGFLGGFAAGAAAGAWCDALLGGITLGGCTLLGGVVGGAAGAFVGMHTIDHFDGWNECAGAIWVGSDNRHGILWDRSSASDAAEDAEEKGRLIALFSDEYLRCGAVAKSPERSFAGIGSTATKAEQAALEACQEASDDECTVSLTGKCNAWTR